MKKTYFNPTIKVVKIETRKMLAESLSVGNTYNGETILGREDDGDWDD